MPSNNNKKLTSPKKVAKAGCRKAKSVCAPNKRRGPVAKAAKVGRGGRVFINDVVASSDDDDDCQPILSLPKKRSHIDSIDTSPLIRPSKKAKRWCLALSEKPDSISPPVSKRS
jgi:hypothetical protein